MATEILQKSRTNITAQTNSSSLTVGYEPNGEQGTYPGGTPEVLSNTYAASENCSGAEAVNLVLDVTGAPATAGEAEIWYRESEVSSSTEFTRWKYSHTVGDTISTTDNVLYDAGMFYLKARYTELAVVARTNAIATCILTATPKLMEAQA